MGFGVGDGVGVGVRVQVRVIRVLERSSGAPQVKRL